MTLEATASASTRAQSNSPSSSRRLRAVSPLLVEWVGDQAVVHSPRQPGRFKVGRRIVELLARATDPGGVERGDLVDLLPGCDDPTAVVANLSRAGLLEPHEEPDSFPRTDLPEPWDAWGATAWAFHAATRNAPFVDKADPDSRQQFESMTPTTASPSRVSRYSAMPALLLPRVQAEMRPSFREVLESRRTHRHFVAEPVGVEQLAELLRYSFGPLRFADAGPMGVLELRASASGGARHETEAFVVALNVRDMQPGLYWYDGLRHGLVAVEVAGPDALRSKLEKYTYGQGFFADSSVGVIMAATARHMAWKYRHPRAYRVMLQDVGHAAQVFSMTAHALGLGSAITGAFEDDSVDAWLGLEESDEFATFVFACGHPDAGDSGLPKCLRPAREPWER